MNGLSALAHKMQQSPALSDNRQIAKDHDEKLQELFNNIMKKISLLEACKDGFSLENYQKQKHGFIKRTIQHNTYSGISTNTPRDILHPELYNSLKVLRDDLCNQRNLPVYMVCSSASIEQMTNTLPKTLHDLGNIPGFGKVKLKQFGKQFIDIISTYCEQHNLESHPEMVKEKKAGKIKRVSRPDTKMASFDLYKAGKTIIEIAAQRNLTVTTIEGHLAHYVAEGKLNIASFIDKEKLLIISRARQSSGSNAITVLKSLLPDTSYGELRLFLASEKSETLQVD